MGAADSAAKRAIQRIARAGLRSAPALGGLRLPRYIVVEPSNRCNLRCPLCATAHAMKRPKGEMALDTFRELLGQITWKVKMLNFDFAGEPLLNPDIFQMVRLAWERKIPSGFDTNAMLLERCVEEVLASELRFLRVSLDGTSQASLEQFRVGARLERILEGVRLLCEGKRRLGQCHPEVSLQLIVMRQNEDEVEDYLRLARELGVDWVVLKSLNLNPGDWLQEEERLRYADNLLPRAQQFSRYVRTADGLAFRQELNSFCHFPVNCAVVLWNGDVILCCVDFNGDYLAGNIFDEPLKAIWRGSKMRELRKGVFSRELEICRTCHFTEALSQRIAISEAGAGGRRS